MWEKEGGNEGREKALRRGLREGRNKGRKKEEEVLEKEGGKEGENSRKQMEDGEIGERVSCLDSVRHILRINIILRSKGSLKLF